MPLGEGFWLHGNTGKYVEVYEHLRAILEDPKAFGISGNFATQQPGESQPAFRDRVLREVIRKGWIRVRGYGGHWTFEYQKLTRRFADHIFEFMADVLGAGPLTRFGMHEIGSGRSFDVTAANFYDDVESRLEGARRPHQRAGGEQLYYLGCAMGQGRCGE